MVQGTSSDAGKSTIVAGLGRLLRRRGLRVRPFKPQNMSNNASVTEDGGEIGRAQALQALACGCPAVSDMNPVLLKPEGEGVSQLIVQGRVAGRVCARSWQAEKSALLPRVLESFHRLRGQSDVVLVEGAGSAAEVNLRSGDIANMGFALSARVPVVLVADIERGGAIASLVGTHILLSDAERALVRGFCVNRFRGAPSLFAGGMTEIARRTSWPALGLIPWLAEAGALPPEDSLNLTTRSGHLTAQDPSDVRICVLAYPRISNFDDFAPLVAESGVVVRFLRPGQSIPADSNLVILPGSKATCKDLQVLRSCGWARELRILRERGCWILGICGGYQMLGRWIDDPEGMEGPSGKVAGLGFLGVESELCDKKIVRRVRGVERSSGMEVSGYEIRLGRSRVDHEDAFLDLEQEHAHGARSADGRIFGCYLHGLFSSDAFRRSFLQRLTQATGCVMRGETTRKNLVFAEHVESALNVLADHLQAHTKLANFFD